MHRPESRGLSEIQEGVLDWEDAKTVERITGGVERRKLYVEGNRFYDQDSRNWNSLRRVIYRDRTYVYSEDEEQTIADTGAWEAHFERHLSEMNLSELLNTAQEYAELVQTDRTAIGEYRITLREICHAVRSHSLLSEKRIATLDVENGNMTVHTPDATTSLPTKFRLDEQDEEIDFSLRQIGIYDPEDFSLEEEQDGSKNFERILKQKTLDGAFAAVMESDRQKEINQAKLHSLLDVFAIAKMVSDIPTPGYKETGWDWEQNEKGLSLSRNGAHELLDLLSTATVTETSEIRKEIAGLIASIADRSAAPSLEKARFLHEAGLLEQEEIVSAVSARVSRVSKEAWFNSEWNPVQDLKVYAVYEELTILATTPYQKLKFAEYLNSDFFRLDVTRGNDPSIRQENRFSGITPSNEEEYGHGIYFGIVGAFKNWSVTHTAIVKNVPLKLFDGILGRGEAVAQGESLHVAETWSNREDWMQDHRNYFYGIFDGSEAKLEPYDDFSENDFHRVPEVLDLQFCITDAQRVALNHLYPDARIETRTCRFTQDTRGSVTPISLELPWVIFPSSAFDNPKKLYEFCFQTGIGNWVVEKE